MFIVVGLGLRAGGPAATASARRPAPARRTFRSGSGWPLAVLGAVMTLFQAADRRAPQDGEPVGDLRNGSRSRVITAAIVLFGLALPRLGLVIALPLLVIVSSLAQRRVPAGRPR